MLLWHPWFERFTTLEEMRAIRRRADEALQTSAESLPTPVVEAPSADRDGDQRSDRHTQEEEASSHGASGSPSSSTSREGSR